jgi:hypothetical protein
MSKPSTGQNNFAVAVTQVTLGTEVFDIGSNFASNVFTAPVTGKYLLCATFYIYNVDTAADFFETRITTSNRTVVHIEDPGGLSGDPVYFSSSLSHVFDMDASDTAGLTIQVGSGAAQMDIATGTFLSGCLVG